MTVNIRTLLMLVFPLVVHHNEVQAKDKVCVIGAGRAGLAAIKLVADQEDDFEPVAFERNSDVGGLWIYTDEVDLDKYNLPVHSSIYKNLRTITPKEYMVYPDYPTINSPNDSSFMPHETFLEYMRNYTDHFQLRKYIQFKTYVTKVTPLKKKCISDIPRWRLEKWNLATNQTHVTTCDAVIVANGHFSKPNIPEIPGINTFHGRLLHSRSYRRPEEFTNQTVVILGAQASGIGISQDLSSFAKEIYLSSKDPSKFDSDDYPDLFQSNVHLVSEVVKVDGNEFTLQDEKKITADAFIFCTGYVFDFPFLEQGSCGITWDAKHLFNTEEGFINKKYPTMSFIGMTDGYASQYYRECRDSVLIHYLVLTPISKDLINKVVMQSCTAYACWAPMKNSKSVAVKFCSLLGTHLVDSKQILDILKTVDAEQLLKAQDSLRLSKGLLPFGPGTDSHSPNPILPIDIETAANQGFHLPCIMNYTSHEAGILFKRISRKQHFDECDLNFDLMMKYQVLDLVRFYDLSEAQVRKLYYENEKISEKNLDKHIEFLSDVHFVESVHRLARVQAEKTSADTYITVFSYNSPELLSKTILNDVEIGPAHFDDLPLLFKMPALESLGKAYWKKGTREYKMMEQIVEMYTNFAKYGKPIVETNELIPVHWQIDDGIVIRYFNLDEEITMITMPNIDFCRRKISEADVHDNVGLFI